jgi:apolipoprotein N-acyltransferase
VLALRERRWVPAALAAVLLAAGMWLPAGKGADGTLRFTLVQPDLTQERIADPRYDEANFVRLAQLTRPDDPAQRRLVLWPESGVVDFLRPGYPPRFYGRTAFGDPQFARQRLGRTIGANAVLLTGAADLEIAQDQAVGAYNVVTAIDGGGEIVGGYAKAHLVPYGEYLPMRPLLEPLGLSRLVAGTIDFLPGPGPRTLHLGALGNAGIQVCYEIVFSGEVVDRGDRPDYIFNPSNDGWFGAFGPPQHLAQARMRAIEEALPVLRSTTTGISAVIDPRGVVRRHFGRLQGGRIDGTIPPAASPTPFARLGHWLTLFWAMVFLVLAAVALRRRPG